jgi:hypothetical protein
LSKVIKEAKILQYNKHILTSYNKTRTTWNIVKSETGKERGKEEISLLNINASKYKINKLLQILLMTIF